MSAEEVKPRKEPKLSTTLHKPIKGEQTKPEEAGSVKTQIQQTRSVFSSLNASIISSERSRRHYSLTIDVFVILLPILNIIRSGTISLRPPWLLLLIAL